MALETRAEALARIASHTERLTNHFTRHGLARRQGYRRMYACLVTRENWRGAANSWAAWAWDELFDLFTAN